MRFLFAVTLALATALVAQAGEPPGAGAAIYRQGLLPSGKPLIGHREGGEPIGGAEAACVSCHRRSGLGGKEGGVSVPPIAGPYLFHPKAKATEDFPLPFVEGIRPNRDPYTDASLARAIREGIGADGRKFSYLMPRFDLNDADMAVLTGYLRKLGSGRVPGIGDTVLHFATIVTPDADPTKRAGVLAVLNEFFKDKNAFFRGQAPPVRSTRKMSFRVTRLWQLHVWELSGPADTWERQLHDHMKSEPVFAVISGLAGKTWEPVQKFCETEAVPCLFPNVDLPVDGPNNSYTVYFSRGVLLEAALIAHDLKRREPDAFSHRLIQVYRSGDVGEAAAKELAEAVKAAGLTVQSQPLPPKAAHGDVANGVNAAKPGDVLVLWLRPQDIAGLGPPPNAISVYASSIMAGADRLPFPADWRSIIRIAYPFDLPVRRQVPVDYALGWFNIRRLPIVSLQVQADTFLACQILAETLGHMVDAFVRDYLIERMEVMLGRRIITGYYPHLSLGPGQRIASKGGYIVGFDPGGKNQLVIDAEWVTP